MAQIFGINHALPEGFEERSMYVFYLADGKKGSKPAAASDSAMAAIGLRGAGTAGAGAGEFHPNVVVTREKTDQPLAGFVAEHRKLLREKAPKLGFVREGATRVGGKEAHEAEFQAALPEPKLQLVQWQVSTLRDGWAVLFFCTTTRARWAEDKPRFDAFLAGVK
jgi:hypothetical protein